MLVRASERPVVLSASFLPAQSWAIGTAEASNDSIVAAWRVAGPAQDRALEGAVIALAARHEALRTTFTIAAGEVKQLVWPDPQFSLKQPGHAGSGGAPSALDRRRVRELRTWVRRPFHRTDRALVRAVCVRCAPRLRFVLWSFHHTIVDAASVGILFEDFAELYDAQLESRPAKLPRPAPRFSEFADWERDTRDPASERYWRTRLARPVPTERLDSPHAAGGYGELTVLSSCVLPAISAAWMRALARRAAEHRASVAMLLGAAVISAHAPNAGAVTLRVVHANRDSPAVRFTCGCLMDFMPVQVSVAGPLTTTGLLERVRDAWLEALLHRVCFARIAADLAASGLPSAQKLFDVGLNWMPGGPSAPKQLLSNAGSEVLLSEEPTPPAPAVRYDRGYAGTIGLEFVLRESASGAVSGYLAADASLPPQAVAAIAERFMARLRAFVGSVDRPLPLMGAARC